MGPDARGRGLTRFGYLFSVIQITNDNGAKGLSDMAGKAVRVTLERSGKPLR